MRIVKRQEILDFVARQPRERYFSMAENACPDGCGCVMVQFGRETPEFPEFGDCTGRTWNSRNDGEIVAEIEDETLLSRILPISWGAWMAYGVLQDRLAKREVQL